MDDGDVLPTITMDDDKKIEKQSVALCISILWIIIIIVIGAVDDLESTYIPIWMSFVYNIFVLGYIICSKMHWGNFWFVLILIALHLVTLYIY